MYIPGTFKLTDNNMSGQVETLHCSCYIRCTQDDARL